MNSPIQPSNSKTQEQLDREVRRMMARRSRRSFLIGGAAAVAAFAGYKWLENAPQMNQLQKPLRMAENWDAHVSRALFRDHVLAPTYSKSEATVLRVNGNVGLDEDLILDSWRLRVVGLDRPERYPQYVADVDTWEYRYAGDTAADEDSSQSDNVKGQGSAQNTTPSSAGAAKTPGVLLTMADLFKLPQREMVTQFKCIEGWSQIVLWEGVRFSDFMTAYPPALNSDGTLPKYAAMETADGEFFNGYEMASLRHPQTLLCYAMGGKPLTPEHGAPLRLAMPLKYGYKQIKQIAKIVYTNQRPQDYWANDGYDWYGGL